MVEKKRLLYFFSIIAELKRTKFQKSTKVVHVLRGETGFLVDEKMPVKR